MIDKLKGGLLLQRTRFRTFTQRVKQMTELAEINRHWFSWLDFYLIAMHAQQAKEAKDALEVDIPHYQAVRAFIARSSSA